MTPQQRTWFLELVGRYLAGTATAEERSVVEQYDALFDDGPDALDNLSARQLDKLGNRLKWGIKDRIQKAGRPAVPLYRSWKRIAALAAAVAAITMGVWIYRDALLNPSDEDPGITMTKGNDVAPGKNTAVLTLADGKVINLDTNKTSVVITDSVKTVTMLTASTPRGGTYQVVLPDGSRVWLNAESKINFPSQFSGKERKVLLSGEAYFEVTQDRAHPFIVESVGQQVEVLGTHFNINSYADEGATKTTLLVGSVRVRHAGLDPVSRNGKAAKQGLNSESGVLKQVQDDDRFKQGGEAVVLKPNQQSIISGSNRINVKEVDPETAVAWKNGDFNFKEEDLQTAMLKVARWYDVEVVYDATAPKDLELGGWVSRKRNISAVLKMIESTGKVHFKVEGRRILVTK